MVVVFKELKIFLKKGCCSERKICCINVIVIHKTCKFFRNRTDVEESIRAAVTDNSHCRKRCPSYWDDPVILSMFKTDNITWCFSNRASWIDYILITNLMHWLLFINKILFSSTCFEPQVLIFRRIQLYICSIWYCHSLWEFLVACRYTAWVRTVYR